MSDMLRILLIDDDEEDFLIASDMLAESSLKYRLDWANTYDDGLAGISRAEHDVYLIDYRLGPRNGLDLLEKAVAMGCRAPIIFLTAYSDYSLDVSAMKAGAADYLPKGEFGPALLERVIRYSVERKRIEEELKRHREDLERLVFERTIEHEQAREEAERRAVEAEERRSVLDALLEHIPEGIAIVEAPNLTIKALSRYALDMKGISPAQVAGRSVKQWQFLAPEETKEFTEELPIFHAALQGSIISNQEWHIKTKSGEKVPVFICAGPIRDSSGSITGAIAAWRDVSDLEKAQKELQEARDDLEIRVYQRTLELAEALASLRESQTQLRNLAGQLLRVQEEERKRIAMEMHDSIGSSLSAIKFSIQNTAQQMKQGNGDPEMLLKLTSIVDHSIEEARRIITDLRPSILDDLGILVTIGWFCRRFQSLYSGICVDEKIEIEESEIPEHLKIIIFRIIQESMNNSAKYSRADSILLSLSRNGGCMELRIEDNGVGFDTGATASSPYASRGFGLTSMKERAELSGGTFEIHSAPVAGTRLRVCWDLSSLQPPATIRETPT